MNLPFKKNTDKVVGMRILPLCLLFLLFSCSISEKSVQDTELDVFYTEKTGEKIEDKSEIKIEERTAEKTEVVIEEKTTEKIEVRIEEKTTEKIETKIEEKTEVKTTDEAAERNSVTTGSIITEAEKKIVPVRLTKALTDSKLPRNISDKIKENFLQNDDFMDSLNAILYLDPYLRFLVDKEHPLGPNYEPDDLVQLKNGLYALNNHEVLMLRGIAVSSLEEMAAAARREGITLVVSYSYRSFARQNQSYSMHVRNMGQREADRVSARPGYSQHQLGLTIDFGSVSNDFARTAQGIWLSRNASQFGWSLSYPNGYETVTGYSWESWHYRYVGRELSEFIDKYFNGIQQYALRFLHEYENFSF